MMTRVIAVMMLWTSVAAGATITSQPSPPAPLRATDKLPIGRLGDATAYSATVDQINSYVQSLIPLSTMPASSADTKAGWYGHDTAAAQTAINNAGQEGTVYLDANDITNITGPLYVDTGAKKIKIVFSGQWHLDGKNFPLIILGQKADGSASSTQVSGVRIYDLAVSGDKTAGSGGVLFRNAANVKMYNPRMLFLDYAVKGDGHLGTYESLGCYFYAVDWRNNNYGFDDRAGSFQGGKIYGGRIESNAKQGIYSTSPNFRVDAIVEGNGQVTNGGDGTTPEITVGGTGAFYFDGYSESINKTCDHMIAMDTTSIGKQVFISATIYANKTYDSVNRVVVKTLGAGLQNIYFTDSLMVDYYRLVDMTSLDAAVDFVSGLSVINSFYGATVDPFAGMHANRSRYLFSSSDGYKTNKHTVVKDLQFWDGTNAADATMQRTAAGKVTMSSGNIFGADVLANTVLTAQPSNPANGYTAYADGSNWNPGGGAGRYTYVNGYWQSATGNFYGAEILTDGDFSASGNGPWFPGSNWSIGGGVLTGNGTAFNSTSQNVTLVNGATYVVTYTVGSATGGSVRFDIGGAGTYVGTYRSAPGTYTESVVYGGAGGASAFYLAGNFFAGTIDNVSFKLVPTQPVQQSNAAPFASLGTVPIAGVYKYCTDCTTAATCAGGGSGHMAVSNGTNWTCQ